MIEESININRKGIKLIMKVIPKIEHHICTAFRISDKYYSRPADPHARTGQGNIISGDICRDKSCYIINDVDKKQYRVIVKLLMNTIQIYRTAVAFVDNTAFSTNSKLSTRKIQYIINYYKTLYEATRGKIQEEKSFYFS